MCAYFRFIWGAGSRLIARNPSDPVRVSRFSGVNCFRCNWNTRWSSINKYNNCWTKRRGEEDTHSDQVECLTAKRLAVRHQHADVGRKRLMNIKWKSNKRTKLTLSNERNNLTIYHSSSESCNTSIFARFARSDSSLAMCTGNWASPNTMVFKWERFLRSSFNVLCEES